MISFGVALLVLAGFYALYLARPAAGPRQPATAASQEKKFNAQSEEDFLDDALRDLETVDKL